MNAHYEPLPDLLITNALKGLEDFIKSAVRLKQDDPAITQFASNLNFDFLIRPNGGSLSGVTWADRRYITLAFLNRSTNASPHITDDASMDSLDPPESVRPPYLPGQIGGDYRLVNRFALNAVVQRGVIKSSPIVEQIAHIGPTGLKLKKVYVLISVFGLPTKIPIPDVLWDIKVPNAFPSTDEFGNDFVAGGTGENFHGHRNAARIGPLLRNIEDLILKNIQPPPFYNEVIFDADGSRLILRDRVSSQNSKIFSTYNHAPYNTGVTWPTAHTYEYVYGKKPYYNLITTHPQIMNPFDGFIPPP